MPVPSRIAVAAALSLALAAAPAYAGSGLAPGVEKKQVTTPELAAPAPQTTGKPVTAQPAPAAPKANANTPVNKGTLKKVTKTQPSSTAGQGSGSAQTAPGRVRKTIGVTQRRAAAGVDRSHARARRATTRARRSPVRRGVAAGAPRSRSSVAHVLPPAAALAQSTRAANARRAAAATAAKRAANKQTKQDDAPLATISRAADHVVEVIPGTVVLALAGLATLSLLLIVRSLAAEIRRRKALALSYGVTVEALATAIEAKDHCTGGHIERVRRLGLLLASTIVPHEAKDPQMAYGFLLHDIGKLAVPDAILRAPGRLSDEEWALMRRHPEEGVRMLADIPFLDRALDIVRDHHERWDGGGYPEGLRGEEIPLWARIFSVVDALDAMTAERPYRPARSFAEALAEIERHAGTQFDPAVVDAFAAVIAAQGNAVAA